MTPEQLKASILQYAIQGKLVEQYPNDDSVSIVSSFSGDSSNIFEIPEKWKWLSIKDVASVNTGLSFKKQDQRNSSNGSLRVLRGGNIGDDYKYHLYEDDIYVDLEQFKTKYIQLVEGDVIMPSVTSMEKICKTGFVDCDLPTITAGGFVYIIRCIDNAIIDSKYLLYFISSSFNKEQCKPNIHKSGQAFYNLKKSGFIEQPICVPPLAEQKRIVAKIEELLPYVDRYAAAYEKLEQFNAKFPEDMKKSILQYAIQGKLVEQRPEEGTGEELYQRMHEEIKTLQKKKVFKTKDSSAITEDEKLFDIPDSWKWVRLGEILNIESGKGLTAKQMRQGDIPVFGGNGITGYHDEALVEKETVVIGRVGFYCGSVHITPQRAWVTDNAFITIYPENSIDRGFLVHMLRHMNLGQNSNATAQPVVSGKKIYPMLFPLPPLAEQKRIVAKIEELLPLCERLK